MSYNSRLIDLESSEIWSHIDGGNDVKDEAVYSGSKISKTDCLWAYYLEYVLGLPRKSRNLSTCQGSILHNSIARIHLEKLWSDWGDVFDEEWSREIDGEESALPWTTDVTDKDMDTAMKDCESVLMNYIKMESGARVELVEAPFFVVLEHPRTKTKYRFTGRIDQLRKLPNGHYWIPDLKFWKTAPGADYLNAAFSPTIYSIGLKDGLFLTPEGDMIKFGEYPEQLSWYLLRNLLPYKRAGKRSDGSRFVAGDLRGDPHLIIDRNPDEIPSRMAEIFRAMQAIRMKLFFKQASPTKCAMCKHSHVCNNPNAMVVDENAVADTWQ